MFRRTWILGLAAAALLAGGRPAAGAWRAAGKVAAEVRTFPATPQFADQGQENVSPSLLVEPEARLEWASGTNRLTVRPFIRLDTHDENRTHVDLRACNWLHLGDRFSILLGLGKVYWGVTESRHLVDIINQTDVVEGIDGEDKLGQPMANLTYEASWGAVDLFYLPAFRERTFPDGGARLRGPAPIGGGASYESGAEAFHQDWAVRWSRTLGAFDVGLAHFSGTSREPRLLPEAYVSGVRLRPRYDLIEQSSIDVQWTKDAWLWKLEAMRRSGAGERFGAFVAGFERTLSHVFPGAADLGLLVEWLYDDRSDDSPPTIFENDLFVGARWALNDVAGTSILGGPIVDYRTGEVFAFMEAERRLGSRHQIEIEGRWFLHAEKGAVMDGFRRDSHMIARVSRHF